MQMHSIIDPRLDQGTLDHEMLFWDDASKTWTKTGSGLTWNDGTATLAATKLIIDDITLNGQTITVGDGLLVDCQGAVFFVSNCVNISLGYSSSGGGGSLDLLDQTGLTWLANTATANQAGESGIWTAGDGAAGENGGDLTYNAGAVGGGGARDGNTTFNMVGIGDFIVNVGALGEIALNGDVFLLDIIATGDPDTFINFNGSDTITIDVGGLEFVQFFEGKGDIIEFNRGGNDIDYAIQTSDTSRILFIDAGNNNIRFGDSVTNYTQFSNTGAITQAGSAIASLLTTDITGTLTVKGTTAAILTMGSGAAGVDYIFTADGENSGGTFTWMEDEDHWRFNDDITLDDAEFLVFGKASGNGIKVDTSSGNATYGFADLLGDQFSKNTGGTKPTLTTYNGAVDAWQFTNGDEAFMTYHIPHDYVKGTDIHLHIHWSQNAAGATGGTIDFKYFAIYAKGWNQDEAAGSFTSTPITATFSTIDINDGGSGLNQYQKHITEVTISAASATAALFDRDDLEPDGVIELTLEMDADNLTGTPSSPFIHYVDIHYQTNGVMGTKSRTPDFYV